MTITFDTYKQLGGIIDESAFPPLLIDSTAKVNYLTFGRFESFLNNFETEEDIPLEVKRLLVKCIDFLSNNDISSQASNIASYSNSIESFSYATSNAKDSTNSINTAIYAMCKEYLYNYPELLYRGRR